MRSAGPALLLLLLACGPRPRAPDAGAVDAGATADAGPPDAGARPDAGACPAGETRCLLGCYNLRSDALACGSCSRSCAVDERCVDGQCRPDCIGDVFDCGQPTCVNRKTDGAHCGACGNACGPTELCDAGACWPVPGRALCNGTLTDTFTDVAHCGACNAPCAPGMHCSRGLCCAPGELHCNGVCASTATDRNHCGGCGRACGSGQVCAGGACLNCPVGQQACNNACTDTRRDPAHCGACGAACTPSQVCALSSCTCPAVLAACAGDCVDRFSHPLHCGGCNTPCAAGQLCIAGACVAPCPPGLTACSGRCVDTLSTRGACGGCNLACASGQECDAGQCVACPAGPASDCDHDGYTVADGDCCDTPGPCAASPELVNPGAVELGSNFVDDNCNGLTDGADLLDVSPCDGMLASNSPSPDDAAKALDICRTTTAGATGAARTWGLISADWQLADGRPLAYANGKSIRPGFGATWSPRRGARLLVISSGIAADATQTMPGPNGGPLVEQSQMQGSVADLSRCDAGCLYDWFHAANPPVKSAGRLPESPVCSAATALDPQRANDSVMLALRLRAPTNARAFSLSAAFFSVEYPEYVCSDYNDQLVAVVHTASPTWPQPNPPDKNLLTFRDGALRYPVGINVAAGAGIFEACERPGSNASCDDATVSPRSCSAGLPPLAGTGFEKPVAQACAQGGATRWLQVRGNVRPGEELTLRLAVWDVGDEVLDSTALLDAFRWEVSPVVPGTE